MPSFANFSLRSRRLCALCVEGGIWLAFMRLPCLKSSINHEVHEEHAAKPIPVGRSHTIGRFNPMTHPSGGLKNPTTQLSFFVNFVLFVVQLPFLGLLPRLVHLAHLGERGRIVLPGQAERKPAPGHVGTFVRDIHRRPPSPCGLAVTVIAGGAVAPGVASALSAAAAVRLLA